MTHQLVSLWLSILMLALLISCGDGSVSTQYKTLDEAKKAGVIDKGWVPEFLPPTATAIQEIHHVEIDKARVEFSFARGDTDFLKSFSEVTGTTAQDILKQLHLDGWSKLSEKNALRVYSIRKDRVLGYLVVDFTLSRAQYWETTVKRESN